MKSSRKISILNYVVKEETDVDVNSVWSTVDNHSCQPLEHTFRETNVFTPMCCGQNGSKNNLMLV